MLFLWLTGGPSASPTYAYLVMETMATIQAIYALAGRQTRGFLQSVFELTKLDLSAPNPSTLSRCRRRLTIALPVKDRSGSRRLMVDSTGSKAAAKASGKSAGAGAGDADWRKPRLCADEAALEIVGVLASTNDLNDAGTRRTYIRTRPVKSSKSAPTTPTIRAMLRHTGGAIRRWRPSRPKRAKDSDPRRQQGGAPRSRRELAADPKSWAQAVEE
jgi:hypothetical protein